MKAPIEEINAFVDRNKEEMLLFWEQLVNRQAGSKEVDRVNRIMHFLKEHFEREGIDCRLVDSKGSADVLVAELNADVPGAPLLLSGHCDTVFPSCGSGRNLRKLLLPKTKQGSIDSKHLSHFGYGVV